MLPSTAIPLNSLDVAIPDNPPAGAEDIATLGANVNPLPLFVRNICWIPPLIIPIDAVAWDAVPTRVNFWVPPEPIRISSPSAPSIPPRVSSISSTPVSITSSS